MKNFKDIKLAILSSYTIKNIEIILKNKFLDNGFSSEIKFGGYNQFNQELIDKNSFLFSFNPDIILIALSTKTFFLNLEYEILDNPKIFAKCKNKIDDLINSISNYSLNSKIILTTFETPIYSPYNLTDLKNENGIYSIIKKCNEILINYTRKNSNVVLIDFDKICSIVGKKSYFNNKMFYLGKILLNRTTCIEFSNQIVNIINVSYGNLKKCLIVDLDNTLWGGVIGEDGIDGIKLDDSSIGSIYIEIQKILLNIKKSGILLAIVSKNNLNDVLPIFESKKMILKKDDFVAMRINWGKKSTNIKNIAKELNIGLDSLVFLDDNPSERLEVSSNLPMVSIINFPKDLSNLPEILKNINFFNSISLTEEDKKRNDMYLQEKKRKELKLKDSSIEDYLSKLEIKIEVKFNDLSSIERVTQLVNKTNQFNLRTIRYSKEEITQIFKSEDYLISNVTVFDKFGDLGLTGVLIIKKIENKKYFIETFLMSCRIISREIEKQFFIETLNKLNLQKEDVIYAEYIKTPKNSLVKDFYEKLGFTLESRGSDIIKKYILNKKDFKAENISFIEVK